MIKTFEQFNIDIDPYSEEIWDDIDLSDLRIGDIIRNSLAYNNFAVIVEIDGKMIHLKGKIRYIINIDKLKNWIDEGSVYIDKTNRE